MIKLLGTTRRKRIISFFLLISFVSEIITPTATFALTGGPSQPEVQAFTPVSTAEMVDLGSGDFKYNIPLMDVGGYPLNIAYNSGIGMDDEASWTGLGWNLNVGSINRNMRGLPDDFNGELIEKEFNMKDNTTYGVTVGVGVELFGFQKQGSSSKTTGKLNVGLGINYNNYNGIGMEQTASIGISAGNPSKGSMNASLGMRSSNSGGLTITPNLSFSARLDNAENSDKVADNLAIGTGMNINSRGGLKDLSINASYKREGEKTIKAYDKVSKTNMDVDLATGGGTGSAGIINFGASTYIPRIQNNMVNNSVAVSFKLGTSIFGVDGDVTLGGYFSNQSLMDPYTSTAAYGYMFSHAGQGANNVLMDFNREKDQAFSRYTKNLPVTNQTYDVFSVTGQGIGGAFRPFRSDVGYVFDNRSTNTSDSYSAGAEIGGGQTFHGGIDLSVVDVNTVAGKWEKDNVAKDRLSAHASTTNKDFEPYYFKEVGEKSSDEVQNALYQALGSDEAYRIKIDKLVDHRATDVLEKWENGPTLPVPSTNYITQRQKRNQVMSALNLEEAKLYGLDKDIYKRTHPLGMNINADAKSHHIAELTALRVDGSRYIYGLPAYNTLQEEITFNASSTINTGNTNLTPANGGFQNTTGYVSYSGSDLSTSNSKGVDNYYNRVKMPPYAHSYLLTAIVTPDYVDVTGDGLSDDDYGNYTKFEYTKAGTKYGWRMPYEANVANFNENGKSIQNDDQGNLVYGEKELWFVQKIITRNYVAVFELGDRHDARGAQDVNGGIGSAMKTKYLKSVSLYSKPECDANGSNAVPVKVVHFAYDYSLCGGVPNNDGGVEMDGSTNLNAAKGKLTLKKIWFTYGKSDKAKVNTYAFTYGQAHANNSSLVNNFRYNPKAYDRWGNYMPLNNSNANYIVGPTAPGTPPTIGYDYTSPLNNAEFPYVDQFSKAEADFRASAWNLTQIDLPSGATINVNYESDDYAFVQNRPAMQMMNVIDVTSSTSIMSLPTANSTGELYEKTGPGQYTNNMYIHFELPGNLSSSGVGVSDEIRHKYLKDINTDGKYLYFRFLANVTRSGLIGSTNRGDHFEYVSGYAEMDGAVPDCGLTTTSGGTLVGPHGFPVAYIKLKEVVRDDKTSIGSTLKISPIAKAVLNFGKTHYNNLVWDASFSPPSDVVSALKQLASEATGGPFKTIMQTVKGPNNSLMGKEYGKEFVRNKSFIRLYTPNGHKFGGGSRVKSLNITDNWKDQTADNSNPGQENSRYGQEFSYETEFWGETVSSGVASYEPMLGGDENPFRQPVFMGPNKFTMLIPDERFFMEEPFGETFFPSASVSYSKVKVRNIIPSGVNVKTHGTGYVVHEFYTAKDYPTITTHTPINPKQYKPPLGGLLKVMSRDYISASQGYVIKLNDMHGKPKGQSVYAEGSDKPLSKVEYFYKTKGGGYKEYGLVDIHSDARCVPNELENSCTVINKDGAIASRTIGTDFDAVADFRETETKSVMGGAQINLALFLVGFFPGAVPTIWPSYSFEKTRFRSAVMTKVISNYGILERTTATDNGSSVTTSNLAYDAQTGDVLVTRTKNDFHDDIYSLKYPAYWGYDLMGPAYKNIGYSENVTFSSGVAPVASTLYYNIGDEIALGGGNVGWICHIDNVLNEISVIDRSGAQSMNGTMDIKVLRSGRRNLLGTQMASLTSLVNPVDYDNNGTLNTDLDVRTINNPSSPANNRQYKVLNASSIEYSDQWQTFKGYSTAIPAHCESYLNAKGNALDSYVRSLFGPGHLPSTAMANNHTNTHVINVGGCQYDMILSAIGSKWSDIPTQYSEIVVFPPGDCSNNQLEIFGAYSLHDIPNWYLTNSFSTPLPGVTRFAFIVKPVTGAPASCNPLSFNNVPAQTIACGLVEGDLVNPFLYGIKGSWRPKITWSYLNDRYQKNASGAANTDIRNDGYIGDFQPFYRHPIATGQDWGKNTTNWTYTSEVTKINPLGVEVENKDALNRYSSAQYGTCGMSLLPLAVASNARLQEMGYDGFEDYTCPGEGCFNNRETHFDFMQYKPSLTTEEAHTGRYSMKIKAQDYSEVVMRKKLTTTACASPVSAACAYSLTCSDFIEPFSPITHGADPKKYVLSYWIKERPYNIRMGTQILDYDNAIVNVGLVGVGSITPGALKKSEIIDGWQRVEYTFMISSGASGYISFSLKNRRANGWLTHCYFDDIRVHPFNSNMKSFVYDPVTLKYVAELDANNFATFYEYDEEGSLVRVKKETEKGIMTIQETKNHTKR